MALFGSGAVTHQVIVTRILPLLLTIIVAIIVKLHVAHMAQYCYTKQLTGSILNPWAVGTLNSNRRTDLL